MIKKSIQRTVRQAFAVIAASLLMVACGGGGGGGTVAPVVTILDSFGRVVEAGGGDGVGVGDSGGDGTAGDGAAIVGGSVQVTDVNGKTVTAVTDSAGYYRVKITGFTPPFVAKVTKTNGQVRYSLSVTPLKVNGFVTLNITGLTQKVASDVAIAGGKAGAAQLTPQIVAEKSSVIAQSISGLRSQLAAVISAGKIDLSSFDPLSVPFHPDHTGYDFVLDNTVITTDANGATQVAVSPTFTPTPTPGAGTLPGNWQFTQHSISNSAGVAIADTVMTIPGASVPSSLEVLMSGIRSVASLGPQTTVSNGTTSTSTTEVTGPSSFKITMVFTGTINGTTVLTYNIVNFSGCGSCGINSQVSVTYEGSVWDSQSSSGSTTNLTFVQTFVRLD